MHAKLLIFVSGLFVVGSILIVIDHCKNKPCPSQRKSDWIKYFIFLALVTAILALARTGHLGLICLLAVIAVTAGFELWKCLIPHNNMNRTLFGLMVAFIGTGLCHLILFETEDLFSSFAFVFLLVAVTDSYAQLCGRIFGRRKLCPHLSPNKTVEGTIGGIIAALLAAYAFRFLMHDAGFYKIMLLGFIVSISAVTGDLIFSAVKRRQGVKDFSRLLPGHGGILDRFDSLIVAAPAFYWSYKIIDFIPGGLI